MLKKVVNIALYSMRQLVNDLRILSLFVLMGIFVYNDFKAIGMLTGMTGIKTNPLIFPFYSSDPVKKLILLAGILFLFSDAPFINKNQPYVIIRSKRRPWVLGQILYIIMAAAVYFLFLMTVSILALLPDVTFATNGWGKIVNTLAQTNAGAQIHLQFGIQKEITSFYSPFMASALDFLLNWSAACFFGLLLFIMNLKFGRKIGLAVGGVLLFWDLLIINVLPPKFCYLSPVSLSRLSVLDPMGASMYPDLIYPFIFFGACNLILSFILISSIKKIPIEITPQL